MADAMIDIDGVWEEFRIYKDRRTSFKDFVLSYKRAQYSTFWALRDVSLRIEEGDVFGIIGENGSGKSTLLKCVAGIIPPTKGSIAVNGRISPLLELGAGLHSDLTGRENIFLNGAILGMSRRKLIERFDDIVGFSELEKFIDSPIKNYSSGMKIRLGFAVAIHVDPEILLIDEVLAVGDADFRAKCFDKIHEFQRQGKTIVLVSHSLTHVRNLCNRAAWISRGVLRTVGSPDEVIEAYESRVHRKLSEDAPNPAEITPAPKAGAKGAGR